MFHPSRSCIALILALLVLAAPARADRPVPEPADKAAIENYIKALADKNPLVRKQAAIALGELGARAADATLFLRKALTDADERVRDAAANALENIIGAGKKIPAAQAQDLQRERDQLAVQTAALRKQSEAMDVQLKELLAQSKLLDQKQADLQAQSAKLQAELAKTLDRANQAEINAKTLQERNTALLAQIEKLTRELDKIKAAPKPAEEPVKRNPPAENVQGEVKAVDEKTGLVTISVGADFGLNVGHTLEVFRLKPKAMYVGTLRIINVTAKEAVGKLVTGSTGKIEVGDTASSRIGSVN